MLLLLPFMGFIAVSDERMRAIVLAIADELTKDDLVLRYWVGGADAGFAGEEGTFTICSFWLMSALAMIGENGPRARPMPGAVVGRELLLYAEEIATATAEHLGTPDAFTHLA